VYANGLNVSDDWRLGITDDRLNDAARDLVDASSGKRVAVLTTNSPRASVVFGARGLVATAGDDGMVRVWQPVTPHLWSRGYAPRRGPAPNIFGVAFSGDRRLVAVTIETEPTVVARADGLVVRVSSSDFEASSASFSPGARYLVVSDSSGQTCNGPRCEDGPTEVRTAPAWTLAARFRAASGTAWSADGRYLAIWGATSGSMQGLSRSSKIRLFHGGTWTPARTRPGAGADFSADDSEIVSVNHGNAVRWSSADGAAADTIREPGEKIVSAELGPGAQVVTIDRAGRVRVWRSARSGQVLHVPTPTVLATLSTDRRLLALTSRDGRETTIWDTSNWKNLATVTGAFSAFSGDDRMVLTQTFDDHIAHAWEARTGEPLMEVDSVGGYPASAFTPDGHSIVAVGTDARIRTYPCPVCDPIEQVEARAESRADG
jgi:WD40 repeat protein